MKFLWSLGHNYWGTETQLGFGQCNQGSWDFKEVSLDTYPFPMGKMQISADTECVLQSLSFTPSLGLFSKATFTHVAGRFQRTFFS